MQLKYLGLVPRSSGMWNWYADGMASTEPPEDLLLLLSEEEGEEEKIEKDFERDEDEENEGLASQDQSRGTCGSDHYGSSVSSVCSSIRHFWFVQEAIKLTKLGVPIILMFVFLQLQFIISLIFVGHISGQSLELDAAALALSFTNVTGVSLIIGVSSAADTLCSQAYGFGNYKKVGIILQRGILILAIVMFPVVIMWLNAETLLIVLQQCPEVARLSVQYIRIFICALPFLLVYTMLQKYLQSQSIVWVFVAIGLIANIIAAGLNAVLIFSAQLGLIGAAISMVIANIVPPLMLVAYVKIRGLHKLTWGGWSWDSLREWWQFLKLGIPGQLMLCCEWWTFEISMLVAGSIDETQLAINSILLTVLTNLFMIPLGLGTAAGVRVGNELGAGNPLRAKRAAQTAMIIIAIEGLLASCILLGLKNEIGWIFIKEEAVINGISNAMFLAAPLVICDHIQGMLAGILRGLGRQALAAVVNFFSYYIVGLPVGISLALAAHMGTFGMWIGLLIGSTIQMMCYVIVVLRTDWEYQSKRAIKNAQDSSTSNSTIETVGSAIDSSSTSLTGSDNGEIPLHSLEADEGTEEAVSSGSTEDIPLVSFEDAETLVSSEKTDIATNHVRSKLKLLLFRGSFFLIGAVLVVAGGVASNYHPTGDYSKCRGNFSNDTGGALCTNGSFCYDE